MSTSVLAKRRRELPTQQSSLVPDTDGLKDRTLLHYYLENGRVHMELHAGERHEE